MHLHCGYCKYYMTGQILNKGRKRSEAAKKLCEAGHEITHNSIACKHFDPTANFFCDEFDERIGLLVCTFRRRKHEDQRYDYCRDCTQFVDEVMPIINKYYINCTKAIPIPVTKLKKRRKKKKTELKVKRKKSKPVKLKRRRKKHGKK